jgi:nucleotide-binding universal stress UspA family protein
VSAILVGYDAEPAAGRALDRAIEEAQRTGARLVVLAVAQIASVGGSTDVGTLYEVPALAFPPIPPPGHEQLLETARLRVEAAGLEADYVSAVGDPATAIVETARDLDASLVVLGHVHHSRLGRAFGADVAFTVGRLLETETETLLVD